MNEAPKRRIAVLLRDGIGTEVMDSEVLRAVEYHGLSVFSESSHSFFDAAIENHMAVVCYK
jgi:isocitrate/isopropylmalate dehydrogenase